MPVIYECVECEKKFMDSPASQRKYCGRQCFGKAVGRRNERPRAEKPCLVCGKYFWKKDPGTQTCGKKKCESEARARSKRGKNNPNYGNGKGTNRDRWTSQGEPQCRVCGSDKKLRFHHVVYEQHVRKRGGDVWDPRNSLVLCMACHNKHHNGTDERVSVSQLRPENVAFAKELLGDHADDYFKRFYNDGWIDEIFG